MNMAEKKFYLKKFGYGKSYFYRVFSASGKKLQDLMRSGAKLFNTKKDALQYAMNLKRNE